MQRLNDMITSRKALISNALQRADKAETSAKDLEIQLLNRTKVKEDLEKRVELTKQLNRLDTQLLVALQKLNDARKKLALAGEKERKGEEKIKVLNDHTVALESKYQQSKKMYEDLTRDMEALGIN